MEWLTEGELLAAGAERDCLVSLRQLRRWRAKGFVDFIRLRPGRGHGSQTRYPPHAVDQLMAACRTIRRGRDFEVSLVLAALECPVPPPGFAAAVLFWRKFRRCFGWDPDQAAYEVEQNVLHCGSRELPGLPPRDLADALGILTARSFGAEDSPTLAGLAALDRLTDQLWRLAFTHFDVPADEQAELLAQMPSVRAIFEAWPHNPFGDMEQAVTTASRQDLATAVRAAAIRAQPFRTPRQSADHWAIAVALATCQVLAEQHWPLPGAASTSEADEPGGVILEFPESHPSAVKPSPLPSRGSEGAAPPSPHCEEPLTAPGRGRSVGRRVRGPTGRR